MNIMNAQTMTTTASFAPLKNIGAFMGLVNRLQERNRHMPGLGVFYGFSGYGKTYSAIYAQNKTAALRVEIGDSWTKSTFLRAILRELGVHDPRGTVATMAEQVIERLAEPDHPPLIIDEADKLVDKRMIELVREIHESSQLPVILIGEEALAAKLLRHERVHNRVLEWILAMPCDEQDTRKLAAMFAPGLTLSDDLIETIRRATDGRARRIVTTMSNIVEFAAQRGLRELDMHSYTGPIVTGQPPARRAL
jgi:DNA transposition AAA+ family ATPase